MSIKIEELEIGSVVRLASGSPKMTVTGFGGALASSSVIRREDRRTVKVRGWSDRIGLFVAELDPRTLVYPRTQPEAGDE